MGRHVLGKREGADLALTFRMLQECQGFHGRVKAALWGSCFCSFWSSENLQREWRSGRLTHLLLCQQGPDPSALNSHLIQFIGAHGAWLCSTCCNHVDCSPPGSSVHGSFQARVLERGAIAFSMLVCEMSAIVRSFEHSLALPFFGIGMKTDLFQSCGHC